MHGGFSQWSSFTECSKTCGNGLKSRTRLCNSPEPRGDAGRNCTGDFNEIKHCRLATCEGIFSIFLKQNFKDFKQLSILQHFHQSFKIFLSNHYSSVVIKLIFRSNQRKMGNMG